MWNHWGTGRSQGLELQDAEFAGCRWGILVEFCHFGHTVQCLHSYRFTCDKTINLIIILSELSEDSAGPRYLLMRNEQRIHTKSDSTEDNPKYKSNYWTDGEWYFNAVIHLGIEIPCIHDQWLVMGTKCPVLIICHSYKEFLCPDVQLHGNTTSPSSPPMRKCCISFEIEFNPDSIPFQSYFPETLHRATFQIP